MTVIPDGLPAETEVEEKSSNQSKKCEEKEKNGVKSGEKMKKGIITMKTKISEVSVNNQVEDEDSCSDNDANEDDEKKVTNCSKETKTNEKEDFVDELTTQVFKMKVEGEKKEDSVQNIANKLSGLSVKEASKDGRTSPQLLPRGPDGGKPTAYSHMMYGQQDWTALQADMRMKEQSGKRGYEEEENPFKYSRNIPVENGDYSYVDPMAQGYQQQPIPAMDQHTMNQVYAAQQAMQRPKAQAYRQNPNNITQNPNYTGYMMPNAPRNLSGGSMTVSPPNNITQQTFNPSSQEDWDPDALLELLAPGEDMLTMQNLAQAYGQQNLQQSQTDEQIMNYQMNSLKSKRNHSGDESGYDSEVSRMSMSITSPYSPDSVISQESVPSPPSVSQTNMPQYTSQLPYSPYSNIGSPRSVDSGVMSQSAGSPASYRDMASPASQMAVNSPANMMYVDSQTPSPQFNMPPSPADTIISELNKPIPKSPVSGSVPPSQYIDKNLDNLWDIYQVIQDDLRDQQHGTDKTVKIKTEKEPKICNVPMPMAFPDQKKNIKQEITTCTDRVAVPKAAVPVSKTMTPLIPITNTMTPVMLQPVTTTGGPCPIPAAQPHIVRFGQPGNLGKIPIMHGGQNIVWVPLNPSGVLNTSSSAPIIVVRQPPPIAMTKKGGPTKPRPILPKMPNIMPGNNKTGPNPPLSSTKAGTVSSPPIKTQASPAINPVMTHGVARQVATPSVQRSVVSAVPAMAPVNTPALINGHLQHIQQQQQQMANCGLRQAPVVQPPPGPALVNPQSLQRTDVLNKLNLARRYVADMKTVDLNHQDQEGDTYLHVAICRTDPSLVKAILERLVREGVIKDLIDRINKKRQTPLYMAVAVNQPSMVKELVQCGADPNSLAECKYHNGLRKEVKAAIHCAAQGGIHFYSTLQELLKANGIALNLANSEGLTALHCAIEEHRKSRGGQEINSIPTVELLIRAGADPNVQDKKSGKTPLMYAIETKDYNLVSCMVNLIDTDKLRNMLKTQTFDGSNCSKICSGLRMDSDMCGWRRINSLILSASSGPDNRLYDGSSMISD